MELLSVICEQHQPNYQNELFFIFFLQFFVETLRKHPPVAALARQCTKTYNIPDTSIVVEEGKSVLVPVYALHHDKKYYPNPDEFVPERFLDSKRTFAKMPYLPFGDGPRACIGLRMGKMQTKVGLVSMLQKNRFELTKENMNKKLKLSTKSILVAPADGIELHVYKR